MKTLKSFIVDHSEYSNGTAYDGPFIERVQAYNLGDLLKRLFGVRLSIKRACECNGDGNVMYTIFDVAKDRQVFPPIS